MNEKHKRIARIVGVLYIIGTVTGVLSLVLTASILDDSMTLAEVADQEDAVILGALVILIMGMALALVPVVAYPLLRQVDETLALGYVVFRSALESFGYLVIVLAMLLLVAISQQYGDASAADAPTLQSVGESIRQTSDWTAEVLAMVFIIGALMFYTLLYQARLVPRWLAGWGLVAAVPYFISAPLTLFMVIDVASTPAMAMRMPLAVQEMVMAVWLLARGFSAPVPAAEPIRVAVPAQS